MNCEVLQGPDVYVPLYHRYALLGRKCILPRVKHEFR